MKILSVSMKGFKNHIDKVTFQLSDHSIITGDNGLGKTTIGEAITWCLLGCNLVGNEKADGSLLNDESKSMEVTINFEHDREIYELVRYRTKAAKIYLNGKEIKNHDLLKFYADKQTFFAIFNPEYFPNLAPKDAKTFMTGILKEISNQEVFSQMNEYEVNLLKENDFTNPNIFLENTRAEIKERESDITYLEGFRDANKTSIEVPDPLSFDDSKLVALEKELEAINESTAVIPNDTVATNESIKSIEMALYKAKLTHENPKIDKPSTTDIGGMVYKDNHLRSEWTELKKELKSLCNKITCPECSTEIDLDEFRKEKIKVRFSEIEKEGFKLKTEILAAERKNKEIEDDYKKSLEAHMVTCSELISELSLELENEKLILLAMDTANREAVENHHNEKLEQRNTIKVEIAQLKEEQSVITNHNATRQQAINKIREGKIAVEKAEKDIEKDKEVIGKHQQMLSAAKSFNHTKLEMQTTSINQYLDKVTVQLSELVKSTGEMKDAFKINYDDKEFNILSHSEKIKAGLEIANLVMNITSVVVPIFIDNAEAITSYTKPCTQIIEARVVEGKLLEVA